MSASLKHPAVTPETFRDVIGRFATGVTVITAIDGSQWYGTTASAVSSLSLEPPMLLVCMNQQSTTGEAISRVGAFAVNILDESQDQLARRFARKDPDKFEGVPVTAGRSGQPLLDGALAHVECRVTEQVTGGTHVVFLAEVDRAAGRAGAPLAYFRGEFGRLNLAQDEEAHRAVREAVIDRALPVGRPLDLVELATRLNVPDRSLEQALVRLADEDLVAQRPDGSFEVVPLTFDAVEDALRARLAVQLGAAVLSVGQMSSDQLFELRRCLDETDPVSADGTLMSPNEWFEANMRFHEHMLSVVGSEALLAAHARFTVPGLLTRAIGPEDAVGPDMAVDHVAIVEAYENGDVRAACDAIRRDYERAIEFNRRRMERAGGRV